MSYQTQNTELKTRFNTVWAHRTPVDLPNVVFTLPSPPAPWLRFRISGGSDRRTTIGSELNNYRNVGSIDVQIFVPVGTGDAIAFQRADEVAAIFRGWCGTNIRCRSPRIKEVGVDGSGYYQVNCIIPFIRDELL
jgi:hypothetical protein